MIPGVVVQSEMVPHDSSTTVEEALGSLMTTLEDFLGHYPELQKLEEMVQVIETFIKVSICTFRICCLSCHNIVAAFCPLKSFELPAMLCLKTQGMDPRNKLLLPTSL